MTRIPEISNEEKYARLIRLMTIRGLYSQGLLTKADAEELLNGNLSPYDDNTVPICPHCGQPKQYVSYEPYEGEFLCVSEICPNNKPDEEE